MKRIILICLFVISSIITFSSISAKQNNPAFKITIVREDAAKCNWKKSSAYDGYYGITESINSDRNEYEVSYTGSGNQDCDHRLFKLFKIPKFVPKHIFTQLEHTVIDNIFNRKFSGSFTKDFANKDKTNTMRFVVTWKASGMRNSKIEIKCFKNS